LDMAFEKPFDELGVHITTSLPIVGIGAPTHVFLAGVAEALKTKAVIPKDAGVANAVGAITGSIVGEETVLIKPHYEVTGISGYGCHSSKSYYETREYEDALAWSKEEAQKGAREQAKAMGADEVEVSLDILEKSGVVRDVKQGLLLETVIKARAVGQAQRIAARV